LDRLGRATAESGEMKAKCSSHPVYPELVGELAKYGTPKLLANPHYTFTLAIDEPRGHRSHYKVKMCGNEFANWSLRLTSLIIPGGKWARGV
jgi:hypothetical protein